MHFPPALSALLTLALVAAPALAQFENTAVVRTVELGGALAHVTTTYAVRATEPGATLYTFALSEADAARTSFLEARIKGQKTALTLDRVLSKPGSSAVLYSVELPAPLGVNATANVVLETVQTHATHPWPAEAAQKEDQLLRYETGLLVISPYTTAVQRTKIRASSPRIASYTTPESSLTTDATVTRSGSTLTYGPFNGVPESASAGFATEHQRAIAVQFGHDAPVLAVRTLRRAAEISHWGANLNVQDEIVLQNIGPKLKGQFSRLEHQSQNYFNRLSPHVLKAFTLQLPAGVRDAYFIDLAGNVSTSRLRVADAPPAQSLLELRPRYPVLGGWNYSFTVGWDAPLGDSARYDAKEGRYVVGVPIFTGVPGAVIDDAHVKVILPEGATDVQIFPPFPPKLIARETHVTYLDTTGRPAFIFEYEQLTDRHQGVIYVSYKVPFAAHFKKPVAVATAFFGLFLLSIGARRVDLSLQKKRK